MDIRQQKSTEKTWLNEAAEPIPYNRTTKYERACESRTAFIAKQAAKVSKELADLKTTVQEEVDGLYDLFLKENNADAGKGNKVFYNFDRSIKIEVNVNEVIIFDDNTIGIAQERLKEFLTRNTTGVDEMIKELILSAFETTRGKLDAKKILSLKRHAGRINDPLFTEACNLIDKATRRTSSKRYFKVWLKNEDGKYQGIDLDFSSI